MFNSHLELLAQIASLYYEHNLKQEEIANRTGYSRSMVSRLLTEARERGIVEIHINYPLERCLDLEEALQAALGLRIVRVLQRGTLGYAEMLRKLGSMAASLIEELVDQGSKRIGISWGTALYETVSAMRRRNYTDTQVYQIIGSAGTLTPETDGPSLARHLAEALGGQYYTIPAPLIVANPALREALTQEPSIARVFKEAQTLSLALVGIGSMEPASSSWVRAGYFDADQARRLSLAGVAGDVCGILFDRAGHLRESELQSRVVGISPAALQAIPLKMGISAGEMKTIPILGACRAGLVNCLVTDETAALGVLESFREDLAHQPLSNSPEK
ncbi:MAG: sugar-binding domain-containing protein [Anaerolineales bacterium]